MMQQTIQAPGASWTLPRTRQRIRDLAARKQWLYVLGWWGVHLIALAIYASLRGKMDELGTPVHGSGLETGIFGSLPTLWLQEHIYSLAPKPLEWASVIVHSSWFFVPLIAGAFVSFRRPDRIGSFIRWWLALQAFALVLFGLFPMRPPWMEDPEVVRVIALRFGGEIEDPNAVAAMPSLHVAFPLMIGLWFVKERWKAPAVLMLSYAALIGFEVVFSGEHYIVDVAGAAAFAGAIYLGSMVDYSALFRRFVAAFSRPAEPALALHRRESGQTIIEFAFALPVILLFLLVLVDFGLALDHRIVMQHAVSEGVREAAFNPSATDIINTTENQSRGLASNITVCYIDVVGTSDPGEVGDKVQVSAEYTYNFTAGGGEMMQAFGVSPPSIFMKPVYATALQVPVPNAQECP